MKKGKPRYTFVENARRDPSSVIRDQQSLTDISSKKELSPMDYLILLSTMYGIGSGIGIIAGTAKSVLPKREAKPAVYYACVALLLAGITRGYVTATESQKLKALLEQLNLDNRV